MESHTPSHDDISKWKGIDIIYFQEDLRKKAKGNISEKSFYTYFKSSPMSRLPRIDILNLLSVYAGYSSWYDFKKKKPLHKNIIQPEETTLEPEKSYPENAYTEEKSPAIPPHYNPNEDTFSEFVLPKTTHKPIINESFIFKLKKYLWIGVSTILAIFLAILYFADSFFYRTYTFKFIDADRSQPVQNEVEVKVLKESESPLTYKVKPNEPFVYSTKDKTLKMVISSVFYRPLSLTRNLENASKTEIIELKPNEYNMMLYSYSRSKDFKNRRAQLENLISDNAVIYQVFDNQYFNVETMSKQRYIAFLSLPTTSLENLDVIESKISNGKIVLIKFRIRNNEKNP
ncbi:hypothetical protein GNY06_11985 [Elizabethkingia argentiflava]|uniref:Uncharacterized protein n=1 Tax=Elizabethkingia argenteiflava TaxID=2681556 RepID=A0A845PZ17_9FLAO|nr:hypothetical protein [Elizabethkingia argenteiflava]NAW52056.1 hypothetical protein [Elizabethkingia argenteiflava]